MNGQAVTMQLYDYKTNRLYNKTTGSDTLSWVDAATNDDPVVSFETKKNAGTVLGHPCDAIIIKTKTGTTAVYYDPKYTLDSRIYANHQYANWAFYLSKGGGLPLKYVIEYKGFSIITVATEIKPVKLGDDYFTIPAAPLQKTQ
jgi:hypothetical protein